MLVLSTGNKGACAENQHGRRTLTRDLVIEISRHKAGCGGYSNIPDRSGTPGLQCQFKTK
ncbi:hypothetical protein DPMN_159081 [Dreissena polymorpha]|uniref:Uncharacterized protein n=1 Tax=Dreissena polymorpha TaxID=45954 RepID=A0A9D4EMM6_DREPO|nr:hypothetical protein DPMN_159081 [Dreissena polymorpha]